MDASTPIGNSSTDPNEIRSSRCETFPACYMCGGLIAPMRSCFFLVCSLSWEIMHAITRRTSTRYRLDLDVNHSSVSLADCGCAVVENFKKSIGLDSSGVGIGDTRRLARLWAGRSWLVQLQRGFGGLERGGWLMETLSF